MQAPFARPALVVLAAILTSCGGSDQATQQEAIDRANAKEAEARAAAMDSPCDDVSQCRYLSFLSPTSVCPAWTYKPYSLVSSPTASALAQEQNDLANKARALAPDSGTVCPGTVAPPPVLTCSARACGSVSGPT